MCENLTDGDNEVDEIVYALSDFKSLGSNQLSFGIGDAIKVLEKTSEHWWWAETEGEVGFVPVNYLTKSHHHVMWEDEEYFGQYSKVKLHREMISDKPRTIAYQTAIQNNAKYLTDKIIMDVGCGTGIISMMCARYSKPAKIHAVEASEMANVTEQVVATNGYSDMISVHHSYVEDLTVKDKVDVIVSEWMGTVLLFEMMIESVITARDKFLHPDGKMWPSTASLFLIPCSAHDSYNERVNFWKNQYGFDFHPLMKRCQDEELKKPVYNHELKSCDCLSDEECVLFIDMSTITVSDLENNCSDFNFVINKDEKLHGFCCWFQVDFNGFEMDKKSFLNTGPSYDPTHWKQNLFLLDEPYEVKVQDHVKGSFSLYRNKEWRRHLRVKIEWMIHRGSDIMVENSKIFHIWR